MYRRPFPCNTLLEVEGASASKQIALVQDIRREMPTGLLRTERAELSGEVRRASAESGIWDGLHDVNTMEM